MRANRLTAAQYTAASFLPNAVTPEKCSRPVATTTVADNVKRWQCQVVDAFGPEASVTVTYAAGVARVSITWGERLTATPTSTFAMETRL
jgi:type IV pilus assembly protein PilV